MINDINKILEQGAKNIEVTPPEQVWQNIKKSKNSRYVFFIRYYKWRIASLIALLALFTSGLYFVLNSKNTNKSLSTGKTENTDINISNDFAMPENTNSEDLNNKTNEKENSDLIVDSKFNKHSSNKNTRKSSKKSTENLISLNEDTKSEENIVNISKYDVFSFNIKLLQMFKYSIYPKFEEYKPVSQKPNKTFAKNREKENERKLGKGSYSLEFGGGPSYIYRTLSGGNYLLRNESEKPMISFQTNIKFNYHINNAFSIQTGLIIETRNEKLNYNHTELVENLIETPRIVTVYHPILPPKNITIIDSMYSKQEVKYDFENINKYTSFNLPILFAYNFGNVKQQYRFAAGTLLNIYSSNNAKIIERKGNETVLATYKEPNKINPSIYSAIAYNKIINTQYSIVFEFSYYKNFLNRLSNENQTIQRNAGFNFTTALKYNIIRR